MLHRSTEDGTADYMLKMFYFFYLIAITDVMKPQEYPIISHF